MTAPRMSFNTDNGRYYGHPQSRASVPSVTNVLRQENKPAINGSNVRKVAEYAVENRERLSSLTPAEQIQLIKQSAYAKNPASRIGDIVHAWADGWIKTGKHPKDDEPITLYEGSADEEVIHFATAPLTARRMWLQFQGWEKKYKPVYVGAEFTVWSYQYGYAGTADFSAVIGNLLVLADIKTGKGVYPEVGKQVSALMNADVILTPEGDEKPIPRYDKGACLHIRPTFSKFHMLDKLDSAFKAFLGLKDNFDHQVTNADGVVMNAPKVESEYKGA